MNASQSASQESFGRGVLPKPSRLAISCFDSDMTFMADFPDISPSHSQTPGDSEDGKSCLPGVPGAGGHECPDFRGFPFPVSCCERFLT